MNETDARRMAGRVFAHRMPPDLRSMDLERFPVANYIVFKDALAETFEASRRRLAAGRERLERFGIEPLFMMDEEGGRVTQISDLFPSTPSPKAVAQVLSTDDARTLYSRMSGALRLLGVDINLAPCADVSTEPLNPIIGTRSFGETWKVVSDYARAFLAGARPYIGCVAKHFPGHGMTTTDSHRELPVVRSSRGDIETFHLPPFEQAIRAGVDGIMISHCRYTAIQKDPLPASLSKDIVGDLLRSRLDFDGLVITDSLDMDAVTMGYEPAEAARAAFDAGVDILLYTDISNRFEEAFERMVRDLMAGEITPQRLADSMRRRRHMGRSARAGREPAPGAAHEAYLELRERVISSSVRVSDPKGLLPLASREIALVTTHPDIADDIGPYGRTVGIIAGPEEAHDRVLILWLMEPLKLACSLETLHQMIQAASAAALVTSYESIATALGDCDVTILTEDTGPESEAAILNRLFGQGNGRAA